MHFFSSKRHNGDSLNVDILWKFRRYAKNNWILRRPDLTKESIDKLFMTHRDNLSINLEPLKKTKSILLKNKPILHRLRRCQQKFLPATDKLFEKTFFSDTQRTKIQVPNPFLRFYRVAKCGTHRVMRSKRSRLGLDDIDLIRGALKR